MHGRGGRLVLGLFHKAKSLISPDIGKILIENKTVFMSDECEGDGGFFFLAFFFLILKKFLFCLKPTAISLLAVFAVDVMLCRATGTSVCSISAANYDYSSFMVRDTSSPEFARYPQ